MIPFAFDTETALIRPGLCAPPLTCVSFAAPMKGRDGCVTGDLDHVSDGPGRLRAALEDPEVLIVGHHVAYDMGVICAEWPELIPLVFAAYRADRVTDTKLRQQLLDIASGCYRGRLGDGNKWITYSYDLAAVARRNAGMVLKKDGFRLHYGEFRDVPISGWVEHAPKVQEKYRPRLEELRKRSAAMGAKFDCKEELRDLEGLLAAPPAEVVTYPKEDALATLLSFQAQEAHAEYLEDQFRKARAAWALHLASVWGLRTDPVKVEKLRRQTEEDLAEILGDLEREGLVRADGSRDTKKAAARMVAVCNDAKIPVRATATGGVSLDSDACKACGDPLLKSYAEATSLKGVLAKDYPALLSGARLPIHTRFDFAETGRSTSSSPNVQNWRTGAKRKDKEHVEIRECFVPRPGYVFAQADYEGIELRTLAQACIDLLGRSRLAEILNAGRDPHLEVASRILHEDYDSLAKRKKDKDVYMARQTGKVANFGFPGGLGPARLCYFAQKAYNVTLTEPEARELKRVWFETLPEMRDYFAGVDSLVDGTTGLAEIVQLRSNRRRGGVSYTAACNSFFQGLAADATQAALFAVSEACYAVPESPLFGCRIVNYVHDEIIVECLEARAPEAAEELARIMLAEADKWLPDVPTKTEPLLMRWWSKDAETVRDEHGRLVPWEGKKS